MRNASITACSRKYSRGRVWRAQKTLNWPLAGCSECWTAWRKVIVWRRPGWGLAPWRAGSCWRNGSYWRNLWHSAAVVDFPNYIWRGLAKTKRALAAEAWNEGGVENKLRGAAVVSQWAEPSWGSQGASALSSPAVLWSNCCWSPSENKKLLQGFPFHKGNVPFHEENATVMPWNASLNAWSGINGMILVMDGRKVFFG